MANTIPDISVSTEDWVDVYTLTNIAVGTSLLLNNKGGGNILYQERATKPDALSEDGVLIGTISTGTNNPSISGTPTGVWLKAVSIGCKVNVREV